MHVLAAECQKLAEQRLGHLGGVLGAALIVDALCPDEPVVPRAEALLGLSAALLVLPLWAREANELGVVEILLVLDFIAPEGADEDARDHDDGRHFCLLVV